MLWTLLFLLSQSDKTCQERAVPVARLVVASTEIREQQKILQNWINQEVRVWEQINSHEDGVVYTELPFVSMPEATKLESELIVGNIQTTHQFKGFWNPRDTFDFTQVLIGLARHHIPTGVRYARSKPLVNRRVEFTIFLDPRSIDPKTGSGIWRIRTSIYHD